jgi:predicted DNA-binding transcriptional regulator AlpA
MKCGEIPKRLAYPISEAVCLMGISRSLLYRLISEGAGPKVLKIANRTLVPHEELVRWVEEVQNATS